MSKVTKVVVSVILLQDGKILLLRRARNFKEIAVGKGLWELLGGGVEFGAGLEETLTKELREETSSIKLNDTLRLETVLSFILESAKRKAHRINILYTLQLGKMPAIELGEEHDDYRLFSREDLTELPMLKDVKSFLINDLREK